MEPRTRAQTPSPSPTGGPRDPGLVKGNRTCKLEDLVIKVGHGLVVHDLASEDKLQATFSHELVDLGMEGREKRPGYIPWAEPVVFSGHMPIASCGPSFKLLSLIYSANSRTLSVLVSTVSISENSTWPCLLLHQEYIQVYMFTTFAFE